jgi:hypothetical protein
MCIYLCCSLAYRQEVSESPGNRDMLTDMYARVEYHTTRDTSSITEVCDIVVA